ncbi:ArnT family glycosyltransferase [Oleiagrimonas soli]|uniref:4-amino-4-deoxy-L-arabinose transferase n=1 Tax=Oleiagrimonas soli TaxID=1543381 RepID=A0A841KL47_9GAMM|nr:glycosyltransferase family 39 protein [Oleiagrimonas soli]MBB6184647.1 4-amino-4-deoxy-L-arabinose transferase [Oleiagrimonas soli]
MPNAPSASPVRPTSSTRRALGLLAILLVLMGFAFQGSRPLWSRDEGRYTDNALQMIASGDYLVPAYNVDRTNFNKPPMTAWLIAASVRTFGHNTWAVRTPYALAFIFTALLLAGMGRTLMPDKFWLPGLVYACTVFPFLSANIVSTDVFLTLFEALAGFGFVRAFLDAKARHPRRWAWLMWLGFGLAFLTKGPPGLMPLLAMVPFAARQNGWRGLGRLFTPVGLLIFLLVGLGWYAAVVLTHPGLLEHYLKYEVYDRVFTTVHDRHGQWYGWIKVYLPALLLGTLPWWWTLLRGMRAALTPSRLQSLWLQAGPKLFLLLWFVLPLCVFILARSRLPLYLMPLFVPLAMLLAYMLRARIDLRRTRQRVLLGAWIVLLLVVKAGAAYHRQPNIDNELRSQTFLAAVQNTRYDALVFIRDSDSQNDIDETTPWGMRLYLRKPIYGIPWRTADSRTTLCALAKRHPHLMYAVGWRTSVDEVTQALTTCAPGRFSILGKWDKHTLIALK